MTTKPRLDGPADAPTTDARTAILARIRGSLRDVPKGEGDTLAAIPRDYLEVDESPRPEILHRFVERVEEYRAIVRRVTPGTLSAAIASSLRLRGVRRLAVPADLPEGWIASDAGVTLVVDRDLSHHDLESTDGVLTGCALGIAQTGTIVLDAGAAQGRRALTLLPDYHLCVVRADQVVGLVPEAVARLEPESTRPLTWISGPSATSDIELNRVEGVHGPRTLEVLLVDDGPPA